MLGRLAIHTKSMMHLVYKQDILISIMNTQEVTDSSVTILVPLIKSLICKMVLLHLQHWAVQLINGVAQNLGVVTGNLMAQGMPMEQAQQTAGGMAGAAIFLPNVVDNSTRL